MTRLRVKRFFVRRTLLVGLIAVLLPLGALLALQYRWLTRLQKTSAIAEQAWLANCLEAVGSEIAFFYRTQAERALNVPPQLLRQSDTKRLGSYLRNKGGTGLKTLFAVRFVNREEWGDFVAYDPVRDILDPQGDPATEQAIGAALSPWRILAYQGAPVPSHSVAVTDIDPDHVIILNPITDDAVQLLGMAGMVVDRQYFEEVVLPGAIDKALPKFFGARGTESLTLNVRDGRGRLVLGSDDEGEATAQVRRAIPFIFTDWQLTLGSRDATPEQWARSNFLLNVTLSVLLTGALLGGVLFAFRTASRELKLSQMKSDFVSNVSHELRTPLASIRVFGEFLRLGRVHDVEKVREYGEFIETESRRLTQLINNILDFSKIESGAKTYSFETARIDQVLEESLATLAVSLRHKGFTLSYESPQEPLPPLRLDPGAIRQALANLVDNAVKYSGSSREVRVALRGEPGRVVIDISDHGIGISRAEQKRVFDRFHRVGSALVHDVKGSGLGLSIVSHIVKAHGGSVEVQSEPGQGSTFSIFLPVPPGQPEGVGS